MRIAFTLFVCCLTGCSNFEVLDTDLDLAPPKGRVELTSFAMNGDSMQITKSNSAAVNEIGHFDLPIGEYYGIGVNEDNDVTLHGGLTYRTQDNLSIFAGASLNTDSNNTLKIQYGTQFLMKNFSLEFRRDEGNDMTMFGIGKEF